MFDYYGCLVLSINFHMHCMYNKVIEVNQFSSGDFRLLCAKNVHVHLKLILPRDVMIIARTGCYYDAAKS